MLKPEVRDALINLKEKVKSVFDFSPKLLPVILVDYTNVESLEEPVRENSASDYNRNREWIHDMDNRKHWARVNLNVDPFRGEAEKVLHGDVEHYTSSSGVKISFDRYGRMIIGDPRSGISSGKSLFD